MRLPYPGKMSVDPATGAFIYQVEDISIRCRGGMAMKVERYHNSLSEHETNGRLGVDHWSFNFNERLRFEYYGNEGSTPQPPYSDVLVISPPAGTSVPMTLQAVTVIHPNWSAERFVLQNGSFVPAVSATRTKLTQNADGTFTLTVPSTGYHTFGADGFLIGESDYFGNQITYVWGTAPPPLPSRTLVAIMDPAGRTLSFSISVEQMVITDWIGRTWIYRYHPPDNFGTRISSFTDADGNTTAYSYGVDFPALSDPIPEWLDLAAFASRGVPQFLLPLHGLYKVTFPNGDYVTNYAFGLRPLQKRVGVQIFASEMATVHGYDFTNRTATKVLVDGAHQVHAITVFQYDAQYRLTSETDPLGNVTSYGYDSDGNRSEVIDPRLGVTRYLYDSRHNVIQKSDALGNVTTYEDDPIFGKVTKTTGPVPDSGSYVKAYDPVTGGLLSETDRLGHTVSYQYDEHGQLTARTGKNGGVDRYTYDPETGDRLTHTDPLGNTTTYRYDGVGRLLSVTTPGQRVTNYTYTPSGQLATETDPTGAVTAFEYDGNRNRVKVTDALNQVTRHAYDPLNQRLSTTDALGGVTSQTYTLYDKPASKTDALNRTTTFGYDLLGRQTSLTDALGQVTATAYDPYCGTETVTDPLQRGSSTSRDLLCRVTEQVAAGGGTTSMTYNADGTMASQTDPLGHTATMEYDAEGQLLQKTDPLNRVTRYTYTPTGQVASAIDPRGNTTTLSYDLADRLVEVVRRDGSTIRYGYDKDGLRTSTVDPRGKTWTVAYDGAGRPASSTEPLGNTSRRAYDALGRLTSTTTPLGNTTTFGYDALGRLISVTDPLGNTTLRSNDRVGNQTGTTDPLGRSTSYSFDALNRLAAVQDALSHTTSFTLDAVGNTTRLTDANGNPTSYLYDEVNRILVEIYADGSQVGYGYDKAGNLTSKADPRGYSTAFQYDAANQLIGITLPDGAPVSVSYDANGNIVERQDGTGSYGFVYDAENRLVQATEANGSIINIELDAAGNTTAMTYPDGRQETLAYDDAGRVAALTGPDGLPVSYFFDTDGRRTGILNPNGVKTMVQYDAAGRLTRIVHQEAAGWNVTPDFRLTYDTAGNIVSLNDDTMPMWAYGYDALDQLVSAADKRSGGSTTSWTYDAVGNRLTETVDGETTASSYNSLNQLLQAGATTYSWDAAGNLAKKVAPGNVTTYTFDSRNRLVDVDMGAQRVRYSYDQIGRMITRADAAGSTTFEWLGWNLAREVSPTGLVTRYLLNGDEIAGFQKDEATYRLHPDWLGSVRAVTDRWGTRVSVFDMDPWGNVLGAGADGVLGGAAFTFIGALGTRYDSPTGLHYMRNRLYDKHTGIFISRDPISDASFEVIVGLLEPGQSSTMSTFIHRAPAAVGHCTGGNDLAHIYAPPYNYALNEPIQRTDPLGLVSWACVACAIPCLIDILKWIRYIERGKAIKKCIKDRCDKINPNKCKDDYDYYKKVNDCKHKCYEENGGLDTGADAGIGLGVACILCAGAFCR